ncbi:hypothetical protein Taro_010202 [Colocasia esculenta]|uniref:HP domain-containing protein n=1 Tax=Colocasia esculenta TaxID=4460 RepID=A0A843UCB5_COLES|nr:hypothetical protein [Colocasia esculenta]
MRLEAEREGWPRSNFEHGFLFLSLFKSPTPQPSWRVAAAAETGGEWRRNSPSRTAAAAASMQAEDDKAFRGAGAKPGLEIWCIEDRRLVFVRKSSHGKFFSGSSYIVLNTVQSRSGLLQHDVHYWVGKDSKEVDAAMVSDKALELDAALGSRTVQYREDQGRETEKFLSYFRPCIIPVEGVFSSGGGGSESKSYRVRLFRCRGDHVAYVSEVPFSRSSLNHNDVFILDTQSKIFLFCGSDSSVQERAKSLEVAQYINDDSHGGRCEVATIEGGKFVGDPVAGEFWSLFGGYAPIMRDATSNGKKEIRDSPAKLFWINKGKMCLIETTSLSRGMLNADRCYMLDHESEIFVWMGRNTLVSERKASISTAEGAIYSQGRSTSTNISFLSEGSETVNFKCHFEDWPQVTPNLFEEGREKVAAIFKHQGYDVKELPDDDCRLYLDCTGSLKVWRVDHNNISPIPATFQNKLYSGDCYVVQYTYNANERNGDLFYVWLGRQSTKDDRVGAVSHMCSLGESTKGRYVMARVFEGREPNQFYAIFKTLICLKGGTSAGYKIFISENGIADETYHDDKTALFRVQGSRPDNMQAIEVDLVSSSLNSSHCYILQDGAFLFTWTGKLTSVNDHKLLSKVLDFFDPMKQPILVREGSEPDAFWNAVGGKADYQREKDIKGPAEDPHLFTCVFIEGICLSFAIYAYNDGKEIFNFTQDDLTTEDVFILDCCNEIFVWVGKHADLQSKQQYLALGKKFLEADILHEGLSSEAAVYIIPEGNEPTFFTRFFDWDSSKGNVSFPYLDVDLLLMHGNSFERKLAMLNGLSPTVKTPQASVSSRRYSSEYAPPHPQESLRFVGSQMRSGSPVSSLSSSSEPVKPRHFTPIAGQLSTRTDTDDSSEASPVKGGEHNILDNLEILTMEDEERTEIDLGLKIYPYEFLKVPSDVMAADIDVTRREAYLSSGEFQRLFRMTKKAFYLLPKWRQDKLKMDLKLF